MATITKKDLVSVVESNAELRKKESQQFIDSFFEIIIKNLETGDSVKIHQFGNFNVRSKNERKGRNPHTGEEYIISARKTVSFRTSNILKNKIRKHK